MARFTSANAAAYGRRGGQRSYQHLETQYADLVLRNPSAAQRVARLIQQGYCSLLPCAAWQSLIVLWKEGPDADPRTPPPRAPGEPHRRPRPERTERCRTARPCLRPARPRHLRRNAHYLVLLRAADGTIDLRKPYTTKNNRTKNLPKLGTRYALVYHLLLALGLRRGEGLGLSWDDVDWEASTVQVRRQVQVVTLKVVVSEYTKTDAGRRTLPIAPALLERLRAYRRNHDEERALMGSGWNERGLIFVTENGTPVSPSNLARHYRMLLTCAGQKSLRLHDLCHTCATLLGERTSDRVIAAILGHTPGTVTARYAKVTLSQMCEALDVHYAELTRAD